METTAPDTTVFARARGAAIRMLPLSAAFVALGVWFIASPGTFATSSLGYRLASIGVSPSAVIVAVGVLGLGFGLVTGAGWMRHRRNAQPIAVLAPDGLTVDAGSLTIEDLPWTEVTGTRRVSIAGQDMLGILVADPERIVAQQGRLGRIAGRANARSYQTPVYISASMTPQPLDDLEAAVLAYADRYGAADAC